MPLAPIDGLTPCIQASPTSLARSEWDARLSLDFIKHNGRTVLVRREHDGPLYVHRPFYPEGPLPAHVYLLHPPGGLVSGDCLQVNTCLEAGAQVLMTTPGAGRVYRARQQGRIQSQRLHFSLAPDAVCEWLPQETILFPGCHTRLETQVTLAAGSRFLGWDVTVLGLPAQQQAFDQGSLWQRFQIRRDGIPQWQDSLQLNQDMLAVMHGVAGLRSLPVNGVFVAGPFEQGKDLAVEPSALIEELRSMALIPRAGDASWAATWHGEWLVLRYLGSDAEQARALFISAWQRVRPALLGRAACAPRIWAT